MSDASRSAEGRSFTSDLITSIKHPDFWGFSSWLDLVTKYRRSALGLVWIFLPPVCYVFGIGYFYSLLFGRESLPFMVHLGMGYVLWRMITQVITGASTTMATHRAFIMDGRIRYTDYVLRIFAKSGFYFVITAIILVPLVALVSPPLLGVASLVLTLPLFILNVLWLGVVVAVLGARFPDLHELSTTVFIFGFLLTPIIWQASLTPPDTWRGFVARLNPAFHLIEFVRAPVLGEPTESLTYWVIAGMTVGGCLLATYVYRRYSRFIAVWL